jgi:hypothetical protein
MILTISFLLVTCLLSTFSCLDARKQLPKQSQLQQVVACLAAQDWVQEDLKSLGLENKKALAVRYEIGSIPGTSPLTPNVWNLAVLDSDDKEGWLLFVRRDGSDFVALRNAYSLSRLGREWSAGEGNGGIATYEAVSRYVGQMSKQTPIIVNILPVPERCRAE